MSNVINYHIKIIWSANETWIWRYNEKHSPQTHKFPFLECGKRILSIRKDWGKWVVINVNKSSCFLVIWWKEILWKLLLCLKSKLLCFILLSAVHFTTQGSRRIDCDLSFYFWIDTRQNTSETTFCHIPAAAVNQASCQVRICSSSSYKEWPLPFLFSSLLHWKRSCSLCKKGTELKKISQ